MGKARYAYFWGCQIPARLPFLEKSTRLVLDKLGVDVYDLDGFTCCPEKSLIKNMDEESWLLTAARNLAVAEQAGLDLLVACNGCYGTLQSVYMKLENNPLLKEKINQKLEAIGMNFSGKLKIKHLLDVLYDDVGIGVIKKNLVTPLSGLKIAVHYGCHLLRPSTTLRFDDPLKPSKYDALIEALGAKSVDYVSKMTCCGGGLTQGGEGEEAIAIARKKILDVQEAQADALTTMCPQCFMQYDQKQAIMQKRGERLDLPVFTYAELLALALGHKPEELGLEGHRVAVEKFLNAWKKKEAVWRMVKEKIDLPSVEKCYECAACTNDCPVAENHSSFQPRAVLGRFLAGEIEELINSKDIWRCVECHTCSELCGQKFGMEKVFAVLKNLSIERGTAPVEVQKTIKTFLETGRLGEPSAHSRKKLGLAPAPESGNEQLKKLLDSN